MISYHFNLIKFPLLFVLFFLFFVNNILSQQLKSGTSGIEDKADLVFDSLITDLDNSSIDTIRVNILNEIAWYYAPTNFNKSIQFADSALVLAKKIGWEKGEAYSLKHKGEALRYHGEMQKSILNHEVSLSIFEKLNDQNAVALLLGNIGMSYHQLSEFSKSYDYYDKALNIFLKVDNMNGVLKINVYLGILFHNIKDYPRSLEKYEYALKYAELLNDLSSKASIIGNIGSVYQEMKEYDRASEYLHSALALFKKLNDSYNYSVFLGNIGYLFSEQKLYEKAFYYNNEAYKYFQKIGNKLQTAIYLGNKGQLQYLIATDKQAKKSTIEKNNLFSASIDNLKSSIATLNSLGYKEKELGYLITLKDLYNEQKDFPKAYLVLEEIEKLKDSIFSSNVNKKIAELSVEQDLNLKEKEIEILNKDKEYTSLIRNLFIVFTILLIIFLVFMNRLYKKNQRKNKVLEENINIRKEAEEALRENQKELNKHKNNLEITVKKRTEELELEVLERKRTEEDLLLAIDRVEAANKAKSVFLENMSHELRTPLVGILGYSGLLSSEVPTKDLKEMAEGINRTGNRLLNTLSMVLDLARIESDKFEINLTEVDIKEELTDIYNNFKGALSYKKIDFNLIFHDETRYLYTDAGMLKVIIENLVNNAIKFTKSGAITIESGTKIESNNKLLYISVSDTGIGIKKSEIQLIFKEFKQLSEGTLKDFQGTGLGLSISKKFTEHLNGELLVESEFGVGSKFTVKLPYY